MSRFVRSSKYRHVFGKADKKENCYVGIRLSRNAWDQNYIAANPEYFSVAWETGGGAVAVLKHDQTGKLPQGNVPLVSGHKGAVLDQDWHPFNNSVLATVSEDCYGRIWSIPSGGLTENLDEPVQILKAHKRKVGTANFNPVASNVLATTSADFTAKVWDIETGDVIFDTPGHTELIQSLSWNANGSQFATTCKDKKFRIIDPRTTTVATEVGGHAGVKGSRACWMWGTNKIATVGFSRSAEREYMLWDERNTEKALAHTGVDSSSGILMPFFDEDTKMLYLGGKGDGNIRYYEITDDAPYLFSLSEYKSNAPQRGMCFMPKRALNVNACEVARALKVTPTEVEPISFTVPRKSDLFQDDIYPDAISGEPSLTLDQWKGGEDADAKRVSLENGFTPPAQPAVDFNPTKKEEEKELTPDEMKKELETLKNRVSYLEAEIVKKDARIKELEG